MSAEVYGTIFQVSVFQLSLQYGEVVLRSIQWRRCAMYLCHWTPVSFFQTEIATFHFAVCDKLENQWVTL